jgi:hypothetical protein
MSPLVVPMRSALALACLGLTCATQLRDAALIKQQLPMRLRGGMTFQQGVLAWSGSVVTLSGMATVLDPVRTLSDQSSAEPATPQPIWLSKLFGLALFGWGLGKLCVRRGYESRFTFSFTCLQHLLLVSHSFPPRATSGFVS